MAAGVLDSTDWKQRAAPFADLRRYDDGRPIVVMELTPNEPQRSDEWATLVERWLDLLPHHHILDAIDTDGDTLLLRYAAIDWSPTQRDDKRVATWGRQLVDVFMLIASQFPNQEAHFFRPLLTFDVAARMRVGFMPTSKIETWIPSDVMASWPKCHQTGLVYAIGHALRDLCTHDPIGELQSILDRATDPSPLHRYQNLAWLRSAFDDLAFASLDETYEAALVAAEEGFGWLQVGDPVLATPQFLGALKLRPELVAAKEGLARCHALRRIGEVAQPIPDADHLVAADAHAESGQHLAAAYRYERAARQTSRPTAELVRANAGVARCRLALGHVDAASSAAVCALELDALHGEALSIAFRCAMLRLQYDAAIGFAQRRLAIDDTDAGLYYLLGRALLVRKRFVEARDAFDRACTLEPKRIEAMLLRREADRCARRVADVVGVARPMTVDLPEHLMAMRDPLAAGRVDEVIPQLELLVDDGAAQLVLAECLAYAQRYEEALGVYVRAGELDAALRTRSTIGRARALLFLERADEALAALAGFEGKDANELRAMIRERLS